MDCKVQKKFKLYKMSHQCISLLLRKKMQICEVGREGFSTILFLKPLFSMF